MAAIPRTERQLPGTLPLIRGSRHSIRRRREDFWRRSGCFRGRSEDSREVASTFAEVVPRSTGVASTSGEISADPRKLPLQKEMWRAPAEKSPRLLRRSCQIPPSGAHIPGSRGNVHESCDDLQGSLGKFSGSCRNVARYCNDFSGYRDTSRGDGVRISGSRGGLQGWLGRKREGTCRARPQKAGSRCLSGPFRWLGGRPAAWARPAPEGASAAPPAEPGPCGHGRGTAAGRTPPASRPGCRSAA
jgi:hypothetical protein